MPELPDVVLYLEALDRFVVGEPIEKIRIKGVSVLKSFDPPLSEAEGRTVSGTRRLGKRLVLELDEDLFMVIHLMVAGRLKWAKPSAGHGAIGLVAIDFAGGTLLLTEASKKKRRPSGRRPHSNPFRWLREMTPIIPSMLSASCGLA